MFLVPSLGINHSVHYCYYCDILSCILVYRQSSCESYWSTQRMRMAMSWWAWHGRYVSHLPSFCEPSSFLGTGHWTTGNSNSESGLCESEKCSHQFLKGQMTASFFLESVAQNICLRSAIGVLIFCVFCMKCECRPHIWGVMSVCPFGCPFVSPRGLSGGFWQIVDRDVVLTGGPLQISTF
jgi:hypothetical protein